MKTKDHLGTEGTLESSTDNKTNFTGQSGARAKLSKPVQHLRQDGEIEKEKMELGQLWQTQATT